MGPKSIGLHNSRHRNKTNNTDNTKSEEIKMIEAKNISKSYEDIKAVDNVSLTISDNNVFGLIGTNGAGKSTFLRILAGILKSDEGTITIDGEEVYENAEIKKNFFYISDEQFFFTGNTPDNMCSFFENLYPNFSREKYTELMNRFGLDPRRKISTFSKGMKKQLCVIYGISAGTKYLLCDETFDGLDPVMRQGVKSIFASEMEERDFTPIIASHNLRELEDICDHVGLLHKGGVILSKDLADMKNNIFKVQFVPADKDIPAAIAKLQSSFEIVKTENRGSLATVTVRGKQEEILAAVEALSPIFMEMLPLSLEEIFISETGIHGYDIDKLLGV